jgi:23S rRNA pseudouridine1911/1915/1917 synthase
MACAQRVSGEFVDNLHMVRLAVGPLCKSHATGNGLPSFSSFVWQRDALRLTRNLMDAAQPIQRFVSSSDTGIRLDVFLAGQPEVATRGHARRLLDLGLVDVPGQRVRPGLTLAGGQAIAFSLDPTVVPDALSPDLPVPEIPLLYDDPDMCAIDKPPGIAAHPPDGRHRPAHTIASWAKCQFGPLPTVADADRPGIVHRLDRETSGVMLVAKSQVAFDFLKSQFRERLVEKEYHCIVYGTPRFQSDWIESAIGSDAKHPEKMTIVKEGGRKSSTYYEVVEQFDGFAHVMCRPKTGRTHQIRVHMTGIGHSLVGDRVYRSRRRQHDRVPSEAPVLNRQCLHALRIKVAHPMTQVPLMVEAPMPRDIEMLLAWLRQNRPVK